MKKNKEKNYERIIQASITLFNQYGEPYVSTNHIGDYLSISPGNIYYYFRNKEEIIAHIFKRYENDLIELIELMAEKSPEIQWSVQVALNYLNQIFRVIWHYRFLFTDISYLTNKSEHIKTLQLDYAGKIKPILHRYIDSCIKSGFMQCSKVERDFIQDNFWLVVRYWYGYDKMIRGELQEDSCLRGSLQALSLVKPYLKKADQEIVEQLYLTSRGSGFLSQQQPEADIIAAATKE
jgi:transcriptional regulator, TetR family